MAAPLPDVMEYLYSGMYFEHGEHQEHHPTSLSSAWQQLQIGCIDVVTSKHFNCWHPLRQTVQACTINLCCALLLVTLCIVRFGPSHISIGRHWKGMVCNRRSWMVVCWSREAGRLATNVNALQLHLYHISTRFKLKIWAKCYTCQCSYPVNHNTEHNFNKLSAAQETAS